MKAENRLTRARIKLQESHPYFGYLVLNLDLNEEDRIPTMGVDGKGNLYYNPDFVTDITEDEVKGVLTHEVLHCAFEHMDRLGNRNQEVWGWATDIVVNNILVNEDGVKLPTSNKHKGIMPNRDSINIMDIQIDNISEKSVEEVYDELYGNLPKQKCPICNGSGKCQDCDGSGQAGGSGDENEECDTCDGSGKCQECSGTGKKLKGEVPKNFDDHIYVSDGESSDNKDDNSEAKDWEQLMNNAMVIAETQKEQGNLPAGLERRIDKVKGTKENWKQILYRYISRSIPNDFSYQRPSRRSRAVGVFMPRVKKEKLDIVVGIDTSGSISGDELENFVAQILRINNSFQSVSMTALVLDYDIQNVVDIKGSKSQILDELELKGGGGTDMTKVDRWIEDHNQNAEVCVVLTDGYTDFPERKDWAQIYAISKEGVPKNEVPDHIKVVKLRD